MRLLYIILGSYAITLGILSWAGLATISPFQAGCFTFAFGCMAFSEGIRR